MFRVGLHGAVGSALIAVLGGCFVELAVEGVPNVRCDSDADCPPPLICHKPIHTCIERGTDTTIDPPVMRYLAPAEGTVVGGDEVAFSWEPVRDATGYLLEVAFDAEMTQPARDPVPLGGNETAALVALSEPVTHYWRVTSGDLVGPVASFDRLGDAIYVFCESGTTCDREAGVGNLTRPFQSIRAGVAAAAGFRIGEVRVAARGGTAAYEERLSAVSGVSVLGGYADGSFGPRDPTAYPTTVRVDGSIAVAALGISGAPTVIDGLVIEAGLAGTSYAVVIIDSDDALTVSNCVIRAGDAEFDSAGVYLVDSGDADTDGNILVPGPLLSDNTISGDLALARSYGVLSESSAATLESNTISAGEAVDYSEGVSIYSGSVTLLDNLSITGGSAQYSTGLRCQDGHVVAERNTLTTVDIDDVGNSISRGARIYRCTSNLADNIVVAAAASDESVGIELDESKGIAMLTNNDIRGGAARDTFGIRITREEVQLHGNVISGGAAVDPFGGSSTGVRIVGSSSGQPCDVSGHGNIITGGPVTVSAVNDPDSEAYSHGVFQSRGCNTTWVNNLVRGGDADSVRLVRSYGLRFENVGVDVVANNTIIAGAAPNLDPSNGSDVYFSCAVSFWLTTPRLVNNILVTEGDAGLRSGVCSSGDAAAASDPAELRNNLVIHGAGSGPTSHFLQTSGVSDGPSADTEIDTELTSVVTSGIPISGNLAYVGGVSDLATIFVDPNGLNADPWDDFDPLAGHLAIGAGLNLYDNTAYGSPVDDLHDNARAACTGGSNCDAATPAWDIGAVETPP